jgi:hypothetical protein
MGAMPYILQAKQIRMRIQVYGCLIVHQHPVHESAPTRQHCTEICFISPENMNQLVTRASYGGVSKSYGHEILNSIE